MTILENNKVKILNAHNGLVSWFLPRKVIADLIMDPAERFSPGVRADKNYEYVY